MWQKAAAVRRQSDNRLPIDFSLNSPAPSPYKQENENQQPLWLLVEKHIPFDKAQDSRTMGLCQTS